MRIIAQLLLATTLVAAQAAHSPIVAAAFGQNAPTKPAFEVASIKPSPSLDMEKLNADARAGRMPRFMTIDGAQATYRYAPLKALIANAYAVKLYQIAAPAWTDNERFDIEAKIPEGASQSDVPRMLQALLEERFKLAVHWGSQERPVLALIVGSDGVKMTESTTTPTPIEDSAPLKPYQVRGNTPDGPVLTTMNPNGTLTVNMGTRGVMTQRFDAQTQTTILDCRGTTMAVFADRLTQLFRSRGEDRHVVDMTGLKGSYQFSVVVDTPMMIPAGGNEANASPATSGIRAERRRFARHIGKETRSEAGKAHGASSAARGRPCGEDSRRELGEEKKI